MRTITMLLMLLALAPIVDAENKPERAAQPFEAKGAFIGLFVSDLEASVSWYTEKLGLTVVERPPANEMARVAILEGAGLIVELIQHKDAVSGGGNAPRFRQGVFKAGVVVEDFGAAVAALKERKVEIAFGPFPAKGKQRANVLVRDNDGNLIQFFGE